MNNSSIIELAIIVIVINLLYLLMFSFVKNQGYDVRYDEKTVRIVKIISYLILGIFLYELILVKQEDYIVVFVTSLLSFALPQKWLQEYESDVLIKRQD